MTKFRDREEAGRKLGRALHAVRDAPTPYFRGVADDGRVVV
jgi:predicted phosphoribosyltransferase